MIESAAGTEDPPYEASPEPGARHAYYAAFLDLRGRECVVVGGGEIGLRKVEGLLAAGARVTVISPAVVDELATRAVEGGIHWLPRPYEPGDLAGCFLAVGATGVERVNRAMFAEAEAAGRLCNIVDVPELCNFILPALLRRGEVTVAVSTAGASPTLAQRLRDRIAAVVTEADGRLAALLRELRPQVHARWPDEPSRKRAWATAVDSPALELLREGRDPEALAALRDAAGLVDSEDPLVPQRR